MKTLKQKILLSFILILLIHFSSYSAVFYKMYQYNAAYDNMLIIFSNLNKLSHETYDMKTYMLSMSFKQDIETILEYEEKYHTKIHEIDGYLTQLQQTDNQSLNEEMEKVLYSMDLFKQSVESMIESKKNTDMSNYFTANETMKESAEYINEHIKEITSTQGLRSETLRVSVKRGFHTLIITAVIVFFVTLALSIIYIFVFSEKISGSIFSLVSMAKKIAGGDLSMDDLKVRSKDETSTLAKTFSDMKNNLKKVVGNIIESNDHLVKSFGVLNDSVQQNNAAVGEIAESISNVNINLHDNSMDIENAEGALQNMKSAIDKICIDSQQVRKSFKQASHIANGGNHSIQNIVDQIHVISRTMNEVEKTTSIMGNNLDEIGSFLGLITRISKQTNLLSLNASIEAARAGQYGTGFTVVADEIRKLSGETASAASEIANIIHRIHNDSSNVTNIVCQSMREVDIGLDLSAHARTSFHEIYEGNQAVESQIDSMNHQIDSLTVLISEVKGSMDKVIDMIRKTLDDSAQISAAVEQQYSGLGEISETSAYIKELSDQLSRIVNEFNIK